MQQNSSRQKIVRLCQVGLLAALVFVTSGMRVMIPLGGGDSAALHLGNVMCLLGGLLLGPVSGGLSAGIGSGIYDLTNPLYVSSAPFTFCFKFLLGFVCGAVAHSGEKKGESVRRNLLGSVCGSLTYTVLYVTKSFLKKVWFELMPWQAAAVATAPKLLSSVVNGMIAVAVAVPLAGMIAAALKRVGWKAA